MKPIAFCLAIDKKNSIEFLLDFVHYLYMKSNPNPSFLYCWWESKGIWSQDKSDNKIKDLWDVSQLCTKQVGTGEMIK